MLEPFVWGLKLRVECAKGHRNDMCVFAFSLSRLSMITSPSLLIVTTSR